MLSCSTFSATLIVNAEPLKIQPMIKRSFSAIEGVNPNNYQRMNKTQKVPATTEIQIELIHALFECHTFSCARHFGLVHGMTELATTILLCSIFQTSSSQFTSFFAHSKLVSNSPLATLQNRGREIKKFPLTWLCQKIVNELINCGNCQMSKEVESSKNDFFN